ncbi:hypothetical protein Vi05172_g6021 [Venturia inaequalis]|nr:hypothetical protein Vi05172_g6021 [Venturia inaequalis]
MLRILNETVLSTKLTGPYNVASRIIHQGPNRLSAEEVVVGVSSSLNPTPRQFCVFSRGGAEKK